MRAEYFKRIGPPTTCNVRKLTSKEIEQAAKIVLDKYGDKLEEEWNKVFHPVKDTEVWFKNLKTINRD